MRNKVVVIISVIYLTNILADCQLNDFIINGKYEVLDLTHKFDNHSVYWPGAKRFNFTHKVADGSRGIWYAANDFEANEHGGTHMDAPRHFDENGKFLGQLPLKNFIVPLHIVDVSHLVNGNPDFVLYKRHLGELLKHDDGMPCVIIFKFGWSQFYNNKEAYVGANPKPGKTRFPGLSKEIAEWIVTSYPNVVGVGVDTASLDCGSSKDFPVHQILLNAGLYGMENIKLDNPMPEYGCTVIALPMHIAEGTGGPLRLVAICPTQNEDYNYVEE